MWKFILYFIFVISIFNTKAQNISFTQDNNGNRVKRIYSPVRLASPNPQHDSTSFFQSSLGISVFPNPASIEVSVRIDSIGEGETAVVQLTDELGKIIAERVQVEKQMNFDLSQYHSGLYYLKVYFRKKEASYKLIKL